MSTPIESLLLDEVVQWGDPWHGVWRGDDLKIHTPHGPVVNCPGVAPDPAPWGTYGDCWLLQIPGVAAPTNDAADIAAGRTWLNYAILSGYYQRLYGKSGAAIYLDPANKPWRIELSTAWAFSGTPAVNGSATIGLTLTEFGLIGETGASQTLASQTVGFTILSATSGTEWMWIEDMKSDGRSILVHVSCGNLNDERRCLGLFELVISGTPPAATFTWTKIADEAGQTIPLSSSGSLTYKYGMSISGVWTYETTTSPTSSTITGGTRQIVAAAFSKSSSNLIGARYVGGAVQLIKFDVNETVTASGDWSGTAGTYAYSGTGTASCTCTFALKAGGTTIASQTSNTNTNVSYGGDLAASTAYGSASATRSFAGMSDSISYSDANWGSLWEQGPAWPFVGAQPMVDAASGYVKAHRYSNALYGMLYNFGTNLRFMNCVGKIGADNSIKTATSFVGGPRHASEHPVTGQIVWDSVPVCWV